ncbi:threonine--tRNA ligase ['Camptotheca acuminata' phytoplasma]|uniref:threonine--tRNA ligase n=1 Tax='Camptotheca acuminata' phytoplasma TaxID=3239192 RepID=UPI00351A7380
MINIRFVNDLTQKFPKGTSVSEIIKENKNFFKKIPVAAYFNHQLIDLNKSLDEDGLLEVIDIENEKSQIILNHNTSLLMAQAIQIIYPEALLVSGSVNDEGFYYEVDFQNTTFSSDNLDQIEEKMHQISDQKLEIKKEKMTSEQALKLFSNNKYKKTLINKNLNSEYIDIYSSEGFQDLYFSSVHLINTHIMKYFKLLKISGTYFEGNNKNSILTRIYGTAFFNKKDLKQYLNILEERKKRDHKHINKEQNFFMFSSEAGLGLPFWLPKGATIRRIIERYIVDKETNYGYQHVFTPILANTKLYETSGHLKLYKENMFPIMDFPNEEKFVLRPMNCPHHMIIFKQKLRSYKELPFKIAELGMMHRYEHSGAVSGLQRTREMTLNDAHIFITQEQIKEQFSEIIQLILEVYKDFDITEYSFNLSIRDIQNKNKYFGNDEIWEKSESLLREILEESNIKYKEVQGDAAFYGPKLDIQVLTAAKNEETLSTIQLDFLLPQRFGLTYIDSDNKERTPILIHRAVISTLERFVSFFIEKNKGFFPLWLAPVQISLMPVNNQFHLEHTKKVKDILNKNNFRTELNDKEVSLGYKIREAQKNKIPFQIVIGDKEVNSNSLTIRRYQSDKQEIIEFPEFIQMLNQMVINKETTI